MPCVLRVTGPDFDVDAFLRNSTLKPHSILRKGERRFKWHTPDDCWGFYVDVSSQDGLYSQNFDAIEFIEEHADEMARLAADERVEYLCLDFGVFRSEDVVASSYSFDPELVQAAAKYGIGLEVSVYPHGTDSAAEEEPEVILKESVTIYDYLDPPAAFPDLIILANRGGFLYLADMFREAADRQLGVCEVCMGDPDDHSHFDAVESPVNTSLSDNICFRLGILTEANREAVFEKYGISPETAQRGDIADRYPKLIALANKHRS